MADFSTVTMEAILVFLRSWEVITVNQQLYTARTTFQKWRWNKDISRYIKTSSHQQEILIKKKKKNY